MGYARGYIPDYVDRCPICQRKGFGQYQVAEIDQRGSSTCTSCGATVTGDTLRAYWHEMEEKQMEIDRGEASKRWWEFWKD